MNRFYKAKDPETGLYDTLMVRTGDSYAAFMYYPDDPQDTERKMWNYATDTMERFCSSPWPSTYWADAVELEMPQ
jgi:hypothetical protein